MRNAVLRETTARFGFGWRLGVLMLAAFFMGGLLASPASAFTIDSDRIVVPVVVHLPGFNGTQWRSDIWVQNTSSQVFSVTLTYYPTGGGTLTATAYLEAYRGVYLHDIVLETFGLDDSKGMLIVSADVAALEVRARIYNTGNASGEFGQAVPGLPLERLSWQGFLSGVTTAEGTRLSLGIANPTDDPSTVSVVVHDAATHEHLASESIELAPHQLVQLDKLADLWDLPARDIVSIDINSSQGPIYTYASVVRNDTGDATFIFGTAPNTGPS